MKSIRCIDCTLFDMTRHPAHALVGLGICCGDSEPGKFRGAYSRHAPCAFYTPKAGK